MSGNATEIIPTSVKMLFFHKEKKSYFQERKQSGLNTILLLALMLVEKCYHSTHSNYYQILNIKPIF